MTRSRPGRSGSTRPASRRAPQWVKYPPEEVESIVIKLAKDGTPISKIGIVLRDQYAIPLVKPIVGKSIKEIISEAGLAPKIPEDLNNLLMKASRLKRHLEKNKSDFSNKRSLQIIESRIRRLSEYYKRRGTLPSSWKYVAATTAQPS